MIKFKGVTLKLLEPQTVKQKRGQKTEGGRQKFAGPQIGVCGQHLGVNPLGCIPANRRSLTSGSFPFEGKRDLWEGFMGEEERQKTEEKNQVQAQGSNSKA